MTTSTGLRQLLLGRAAKRVQKQQAFFQRKDAGDLLILITESDPAGRLPKTPARIFNQLIGEDEPGRFPDQQRVDRIMEGYLRRFRAEQAPKAAAYRDDAVPVVPIHFDIGVQTAVLTDLEPVYQGEHWWLEPNLSWEEIAELRFNPDNPWARLLLQINRSLWRLWDADFYFLPFLHRSPLDAANGIRGNELFVEMHTAPDQVQALVDWCVDSELAIEAFIHDNAPRPAGWGSGHMGTWLPPRAVWINGDPVGLISREMMPVFEQPYTGRLFTSTGGGFFHNHTRGLYQVDQVARTQGILVQQFTRDPKCPTVTDVLLGDPLQRDIILEASMVTPIYLSGVLPDELLSALPILAGGRFIVNVACDPERDDVAGLIARVRAASNL